MTPVTGTVTKLELARDFFSVILTETPPDDLLELIFDFTTDLGPLQDFIGTHSRIWWSTNIGCIDAFLLLLEGAEENGNIRYEAADDADEANNVVYVPEEVVAGLKAGYTQFCADLYEVLREQVEASTYVSEYTHTRACRLNLGNCTEIAVVDDRLVLLDADGYHYRLETFPLHELLDRLGIEPKEK